ncbi:MAG: cell wall hydrolase [Lachnospiraceae bacterium]|nr:cell wall hydrolase [Lachnospiraceae bacterium]
MRSFKRISKKLLSLLLIFCMFTVKGTIEVYSEESISERIKKAEELKQQTEAQKQAIDEKKDNLEEQKSELLKYLTSLNENFESLSENLEAIESRLIVKEEELSKITDEVNGAKEEEARQYDLMKKRVRYMYERGDSNVMEAFISSENYVDFLNKAEYIGKIEAYDRKMYEELIAIREKIEVEEEKLEEEKAVYDEMKAVSLSEQEKVGVLISSTNGSISQTTGAISVAEIEQAAKDEEIKEQQANLSELKRQLSEEQAMSKKASKMSWRDISQISKESGDRDILASLIYCEAGGEPYIGKVAVGAVVINRMRSAAFPNTMLGVIYQKGQFSPVASGRLAARLALGAPEECYRAADEAMSGSTPVGNCLYFRRATPSINGQIIGAHVFY